MLLLAKPEDHRFFEQTELEYQVAKKIDHPYVRKCYKLQKIRSMFRVRELLLSMEHFEGKTLEGSRADYQAYLRKSREASAQGLGPMAAALRKLREP